MVKPLPSAARPVHEARDSIRTCPSGKKKLVDIPLGQGLLPLDQGSIRDEGAKLLEQLPKQLIQIEAFVNGSMPG